MFKYNLNTINIFFFLYRCKLKVQNNFKFNVILAELFQYYEIKCYVLKHIVDRVSLVAHKYIDTKLTAMFLVFETHVNFDYEMYRGVPIDIILNMIKNRDSYDHDFINFTMDKLFYSKFLTSMMYENLIKHILKIKEKNDKKKKTLDEIKEYCRGNNVGIHEFNNSSHILHFWTNKISLFYVIREVIKYQFSQFVFKSTKLNIKNNTNFKWTHTLVIASCSLIIYVFFKVLVSFYKINPMSFFLKQSFTMALIFSIYVSFSFLNNSLLYGKYVSINQRFWKTSFTAFWIIEFFLFFLFTFLTLIAPNESTVVLDAQRWFLIDKTSPHFMFYITLIFIAFSSASLYILTNSSVYKRFKNYILTILALSVSMHIFLFFEYNKFMGMLRIFKYKKRFFEHGSKSPVVLRFREKDPSELTDVSLAEAGSSSTNSSRSNRIYTFTNVFKNRTEGYFLMLLIILKFWHVAAVFFMYLFCTGSFFKNQKISVDFNSALSIAIIYLVIFHFYVFLMFFKQHFYCLVFFRQYSNKFTFNLRPYINEILILFKNVKIKCLNTKMGTYKK